MIKYLFLISTIFFAFQVEGMFLEQAALKATRCVTRANVLSRGFKSVSEELSNYRVARPKFSEEGIRPFQSLSGNHYQYTQSRKPSNWLLLAASGGTLAALSCNKVFAKSEPQGDLREDELEEAFLTGYEKAQAIKEQKEVVFVLGNAGAGKSTFIARLMGAKTVENKDEYGHKTVKITENPERFPKISYNSFEAKIFYPELWFADDVTLCDCPEFKDSRGKNYQFVENVCLEYAVRVAKSKKFVVVVAENTMTADRGNSFKELIRDLSNLLTNREDFYGAPGEKTTLDSIMWAITKAPFDRTLQEIRNRIRGLERNTGEKKEKERALLNSIGGQNTVLFGSFDRRRVFFHIRGLEATLGTQISLVDSDQKQKFANLSVSVFQEAFSLDEEINTILREIEELNKVVQSRDWLQNIHLANLDTIREKLMEIMGETIEKTKKKKENHVEKYNETLEKLQRLEKDKKETLVWDYTHSEERSWGSLSWTVFDFKYNEGKPFTRVEVEKDQHTTEYKRKEDGEKGFFEAQYKGGMGRQCRVTVRLFKEAPEFIALKKLSTDRLKEVKEKINEIGETETVLDYLKTAVERGEIGEIEGAKIFLTKIDSSDSEQALMKLVKKSEGIRVELEKKVKIGYALLEMDPDDLSHHPLAEQFLRQFKK